MFIIGAMFPPPLAGFKPAIVTPTFNGESSGWSGYTMRQLVAQGTLLETGGSAIRLTLQPAVSAGAAIGEMWVGKAIAGYSSTSDASFDGPPTQVFFGGNPGVNLTASGSDVVSDDVAIGLPSSDGLLISWYASGASSFRYASTHPSGWLNSYRSGNSASTESIGGYTSTSDSWAYLIKQIEVR